MDELNFPIPKLRHIVVILIILSLFYGAFVLFSSIRKQIAIFKLQNKLSYISFDSASASQYAPNQIIVTFFKDSSEKEIKKFLKQNNVKVISEDIERNFKVLQAPDGKTELDLIDIIKTSSLVEDFELNYYATANISPDDTYYKYQWPLNGSGKGSLKMSEIWDLTATADTSSTIIAVIDTGIAYENYQNFKKAPDYAGDTFVQGYDFVNNDSHANDDAGHGTFVASIIASQSNNKKGTAGISPKVKIMPVKVLDNHGRGDIANVAKGIYYAVDHGAKIMNISLGTPSNTFTLYNAINYAYSKGAVIVVSCGNDSHSHCTYPAAYSNQVIPVSAVKFDGTLATYSSTGNGVVYAPGGDLKYDQNKDGYKDGVLAQTFVNNDSTKTENFGYYFSQGTSFAAPHITALASLMLAEKPDMDLPDIKSTLETSNSDVPDISNIIKNLKSEENFGSDASIEINLNLQVQTSEEKKCGEKNCVEEKCGGIPSRFEVTISDLVSGINNNDINDACSSIWNRTFILNHGGDMQPPQPVGINSSYIFYSTNSFILRAGLYSNNNYFCLSTLSVQILGWWKYFSFELDDKCEATSIIPENVFTATNSISDCQYSSKGKISIKGVLK